MPPRKPSQQVVVVDEATVEIEDAEADRPAPDVVVAEGIPEEIAQRPTPPAPPAGMSAETIVASAPSPPAGLESDHGISASTDGSALCFCGAPAIYTTDGASANAVSFCTRHIPFNLRRNA